MILKMYNTYNVMYTGIYVQKLLIYQVQHSVHVHVRVLTIITPRAHARSGVKQWVLSVSVSVCQCVSVSVCQSVIKILG